MLKPIIDLTDCDYAFFQKISLGESEIDLGSKIEIIQKSVKKINITSDNEEKELLEKIEELGSGVLVKIIKSIPEPIKHMN